MREEISLFLAYLNIFSTYAIMMIGSLLLSFWIRGDCLITHRIDGHYLVECWKY
jgi:hypothetical protein